MVNSKRWHFRKDMPSICAKMSFLLLSTFLIKQNLQIPVAMTYRSIYRSNRSRMSFSKGVLKTFAIFTGKHLRQSHFLKDLQVFRPATLSKETLLTQVFSREYFEIFNNRFFDRISTVASSVYIKELKFFKKCVLSNQSRQLLWFNYANLSSLSKTCLVFDRHKRLTNDYILVYVRHMLCLLKK